MGPPFYCPDPDCGKTFDRACDRDKHNNKHTKPSKCPICGPTSESFHGTAQKRDLHRHMWAHHPNTARDQNIPREEAPCRYCHKMFRKDNGKRHERKCPMNPNRER
ncbi:hypothetical protein B0H63DRAFT_473887 [Podospora didyma]|uniref:C2H2-type domain-containing protein n=1 Tax=Podospora didyma TaxID=330526 RepID=A0AAE0NQR7_9PEZI|nr:hypothetical protein B0H63DRAFT_473887 [Podospora didyma]